MLQVLMVAGEKDTRTAMCCALARAGFSVQEAETGLAALIVMASSSHRPVVVLDDPLPDLDGLAVVQFAVAALCADWHASIVLLRSQPWSLDVPAKLGRGAATPFVLIKPFTFDTLVTVVRLAATRRAVGAQRAAREPPRAIQAQ